MASNVVWDKRMREKKKRERERERSVGFKLVFRQSHMVQVKNGCVPLVGYNIWCM